MRQVRLVFAVAVVMAASIVLARQAPSTGLYKVLKTVKVGGAGGFDYVYADEAGRRLYIARGAAAGRITVFNLDTLEGQVADRRLPLVGQAVSPPSRR